MGSAFWFRIKFFDCLFFSWWKPLNSDNLVVFLGRKKEKTIYSLHFLAVDFLTIRRKESSSKNKIFNVQCFIDIIILLCWFVWFFSCGKLLAWSFPTFTISSLNKNYMWLLLFNPCFCRLFPLLHNLLRLLANTFTGFTLYQTKAKNPYYTLSTHLQFAPVLYCLISTTFSDWSELILSSNHLESASSSYAYYTHL